MRGNTPIAESTFGKKIEKHKASSQKKTGGVPVHLYALLETQCQSMVVSKVDNAVLANPREKYKESDTLHRVGY